MMRRVAAAWLLAGCSVETEPLCWYGPCGPEQLHDTEACSVIDQDCPDGQKCAPSELDIEDLPPTVCVDVIGARQIGQSCQEYAYGYDDCEAGLVCFESRCREWCSSRADCDADDACVNVWGTASFACMPTCTPYDDACPELERCMLAQDVSGPYRFACQSNRAQTYNEGAPCDSPWACGVGLTCLTLAPGPGWHTCVPYCNLAAPTCDTGDTCEPYATDYLVYEDRDVGTCLPGG